MPEQEYFKGILVPIIMGSESDMWWAEKIKDELDFYKIKSQYRIASAHRTPEHIMKVINEYNMNLDDKILIISVAGGTDTLSGMLAAQSKWLVISCPPKDNALYESCLNNPSGSCNALIKKPENIAKSAAQYFGIVKPELQDIILKQIREKEEKILVADKKYR